TNNKTPVVISIPTKSWKTLDKSCAAPLNPLAYTFALMRKKFSDTANKTEPTITTAIRFASIRNMCDSPFLSSKYFDASLKHILNEVRCVNSIHIYTLMLFDIIIIKKRFYQFLIRYLIYLINILYI